MLIRHLKCALKNQTSLQKRSLFCITHVEMETQEGEDSPLHWGSQRPIPTCKHISGPSFPVCVG